MATTTATKNGKAAGLETIGGDSPTNDAADTILMARPDICHVTIRGTSALLFHRWSNEAVAEKAAAAKNSVAKKTDNVESYVYRDADGRICLPGEYLRMAVVMTAKFKQDPRSPRKSMFDLAKAAVITLDELAPICTDSCPDGVTDWDYLDARRVTVQRNGVTRQRPAFNAGWSARFSFLLNLPQYVGPALLNELLSEAGRVTGVGDFRPTFGRFQVVRFDVGLED